MDPSALLMRHRRRLARTVVPLGVRRTRLTEPLAPLVPLAAEGRARTETAVPLDRLKARSATVASAGRRRITSDTAALLQSLALGQGRGKITLETAAGRGSRTALVASRDRTAMVASLGRPTLVTAAARWGELRLAVRRAGQALVEAAGRKEVGGRVRRGASAGRKRVGGREARWGEVHPEACPEVRQAGKASAARLAQVVAVSHPPQTEEARWEEVHLVALEVPPAARLEAWPAGQVGAQVALEARPEVWQTDQAGIPAASVVLNREGGREEARPVRGRASSKDSAVLRPVGGRASSRAASRRVGNSSSAGRKRDQEGGRVGRWEEVHLVRGRASSKDSEVHRPVGGRASSRAASRPLQHEEVRWGEARPVRSRSAGRKRQGDQEARWGEGRLVRGRASNKVAGRPLQHEEVRWGEDRPVRGRASSKDMAGRRGRRRREGGECRN